MQLPQLRQRRGDPKHEVVEEQSLDKKLLSVVTDAERDTLAKDTKSKKGTIVSQMCSLIIQEEDHNCEVCKKTEDNTCQL